MCSRLLFKTANNGRKKTIVQSKKLGFISTLGREKITKPVCEINNDEGERRAEISKQINQGYSVLYEKFHDKKNKFIIVTYNLIRVHISKSRQAELKLFDLGSLFYNIRLHTHAIL